MFQRYIQLSYWLYQNYIYYNQNHDFNESYLDQLCNSITRCGSVCIKFTQWITPILELTYVEENDLFTKDREKPLWLTKLESFYENCEVHDIEYTKEIYKESFHSELDKDYEIIDVIASGSIGQVYKLKQGDKFYAMKVIHPNITHQIQFIRRFLRFLFYFSKTRKIVTNLLPFNLLQFVDNFEKQCNLIYESNNLLQFYHTYKDNEFIVIPTLYKISQKILLMSYEEGIQYSQADINEYQKYKIINLFHLFARNNTTINFNHGDLHNGNWKIRPYKNNYQLIIYDFGFCWSVLPEYYYIVDISTECFETPPEDGIDIDDFCKMMNYCIGNLDGRINHRIVYEYLEEELKQVNTGILSPVQLYQITAKFCILHSILIDPIMIQFIIITIQLSLNLIDFNLQGSSKNPISNTIVYKERYLDVLSFCKTYNIFPEYRKNIENKMKQHTLLDNIFETISMPDSIKQMALQ